VPRVLRSQERDVWRGKRRSRLNDKRHSGFCTGARVVTDFEHVVVTLDQARQHRARPKVDFFRPGRDVDAPGRSHLDDAITLNGDHLVT
jgi:hypothetical protein